MDKLYIGDYRFDLGFFGIADMGNIQMIIQNSSIAEIATVFSNPTIMNDIAVEHGGERQTYIGFTVLQVIAPTDDGVRVSIRRKYVGE